MAARMSSIATPYLFSRNGLAEIRTAGSEPPPISTSPTPVTWARRWATTFETAS
jgi:hypothetical protein